MQPIWSDTDELSALFGVLFGRYPSPEKIFLDYAGMIRNSLPTSNKSIEQGGEIPLDLISSISPVDFTSLGVSRSRSRRLGIDRGLMLGDATSFNDLLLFWNLRAAGAHICFYDQNRATRFKRIVDAFLAEIRRQSPGAPNRVNIWGRSPAHPWDPSSTGLDFSGMVPTICGGGDSNIWTVLEPARPRFSSWRRDVIASYTEADGAASTSFALPDRPFDDEDLRAINQLFVVTVDADQYGSASEDLTFATPYVSRMNEFYGRNFTWEHDHARSEPGSFGRGAVGLITAVGTQRWEARAYRPLIGCGASLDSSESRLSDRSQGCALPA